MKTRYDLTTTPVKYDIGQRVWVYTPITRKGLSKKPLHHCHGPYRVIEKCSPVNYKLRNAANRVM